MQQKVTSSPVRIVVVSTLAALVIAVGCSTAGGAGGTAAGASRGERFFKTKCNSCHPNGGQGAGPPIELSIAPDFLERGKTSGRHAVPEADSELVSAAVGYYAPRFIAGDRFGEMDAETWNGFAEFLVGAGILEEVGDVDAAWTNDLLPEAG